MKKILLSALLFLMPLFAAAAVVNDSIYVLNVDFESGKILAGLLGENGNFVLMHGVGNLPGNRELDVPLPYGDYYFVEAAMRYLAL